MLPTDYTAFFEIDLCPLELLKLSTVGFDSRQF